MHVRVPPHIICRLPITLHCKPLTPAYQLHYVVSCLHVSSQLHVRVPPLQLRLLITQKFCKLTRITVVVHVVCIVEIFCGINFHCGIDHHMQSLTQDKKILWQNSHQWEQVAKLVKIFSWQKFPHNNYTILKCTPKIVLCYHWLVDIHYRLLWTANQCADSASSSNRLFRFQNPKTR